MMTAVIVAWCVFCVGYLGQALFRETEIWADMKKTSYP